MVAVGVGGVNWDFWLFWALSAGLLFMWKLLKTHGEVLFWACWVGTCRDGLFCKLLKSQGRVRFCAFMPSIKEGAWFGSVVIGPWRCCGREGCEMCGALFSMGVSHCS
jgi:hypothetical protein